MGIFGKKHVRWIDTARSAFKNLGYQAEVDVNNNTVWPVDKSGLKYGVRKLTTVDGKSAYVVESILRSLSTIGHLMCPQPLKMERAL